MIELFSSDNRSRRTRFFYLTVVALTAIGLFITSCADRGAVNKEKATDNINIYFNNDRLSGNPMDCAAVFPVSRTINTTIKPEKAALRSLFKGPSPQEQAAGYRSYFSKATKDLLNKVWVEDGVAYVDLSDKRRILSGATSSCGGAEFRSQIERTLFQFPSIVNVIYAIDGNAKSFYEWMNESCDESNNNCNFPITSPED